MNPPEPDRLEGRIDSIFVALGRMSDADLIAVRGAWMGGDADVREGAWTKARAAARRDPRSRMLDQGRDRLASWVNDVGITWAGAYNRSVVVPAGMDQGNLRMNAVPAVLDAMVAVIFDDELTDDERDALLEPLRRVTEPPPAEDEDE